MAELIRVENVVKQYRPARGRLGNSQKIITAVAGVSFSIASGVSFGLIGESGSGKSTLGRLVINLISPTAGKVWYRHQDLAQLSAAAMKQLRPKLQPIFQDADNALDPRFTVFDLIAEPLRLQKIAAKRIQTKVTELLDRVNLGGELLNRYPHELSGGQRQRIGMARALALEPELLVADEPAASLDISVQAQLLDLLRQTRAQGATLLYISHNLRIARMMTQELAVMYQGKLVEMGDTESIFTQPLHPYTKLLIGSLLAVDPLKRSLRRNRAVPARSDLFATPTGCRFYPRCPDCRDICKISEPQFRAKPDKRSVACHFA